MAKSVAVLRDSAEMTRARATLAAVTAARRAHLALDMNSSLEEHQTAMQVIRQAEFECELALVGLVRHVDWNPIGGAAAAEARP